MVLPQNMNPMSPTGIDQDFFKYRINGSDILEELEHQLKGEAWDDETRSWQTRYLPWVNKEGMSKVIHVVYSCGVNKNVVLGNLTHEEIYFKCNLMKKKLARLMFNNYHFYGIRKDTRDLLITTVVNTIHSGLSRCEGGKEADQLSTAAQRHEIYHEGLKNNEKSKMNPFNWFGKGG